MKQKRISRKDVKNAKDFGVAVPAQQAEAVAFFSQMSVYSPLWLPILPCSAFHSVPPWGGTLELLQLNKLSAKKVQRSTKFTKKVTLCHSGTLTAANIAFTGTGI